MNPAVKPVAPPPAPSRMKLTSLVSGKLKKPKKVVLYGPEGIGKTTFGANAPDPIFLCAEQGTEQLDVTRFPTPTSWSEVLEALRELATAEHSFKTLVVDTLDWIEPLIFAHVIAGAKGKATSINDGDLGYGNGFRAATDQWRVFLRGLEHLREHRGMNIVLLAHATVKEFKNPEGDNYERYELTLQKEAAGLLKQWPDSLLFAAYETYTAKGKGEKRAKGVDTGARLIFTSRRAAFDAKNRDGLPETLPLSWGDFAAAADAHVPAPDLASLREEIERKAHEVGGEIESKALESLAKLANDPQKLAVLNNRLNSKLAEMSATEERTDA